MRSEGKIFRLAAVEAKVNHVNPLAGGYGDFGEIAVGSEPGRPSRGTISSRFAAAQMCGRFLLGHPCRTP